MSDTCESCAYFEPWSKPNPYMDGICRIKLPSFVDTSKTNRAVDKTSGCALHKPAPPKGGKTRVVL